MKLQITIDGKTYAVDVELVEEEETPPAGIAPAAPIPSFPPPPPARNHAAPGDDPKVCRSPVTGLVIKVNAEPGQAVEAGQLLVVLEAMKMESNIVAPAAGTVKSVNVAQGDSVKTNQVLVEME